MSKAKTEFIHQNATPEGLDFLRKWIFGIWLIVIAFDPLDTLAFMPPSSFEPTGLFKLWPEALRPVILTLPFLWGFKLVMLGSIVCVLINRYTIPALILCSVCLTLHQSLIRSLGLINHTEIAILLSVYILTLSAVADRMVKKADRAKVNLNSFPFVAIVAALCSTYAFIGIYRVVYGGNEVFQSDSLISWIVQGSNRVNMYPWHLDGYVLENEWLQHVLKFGLKIGTVFEVLAPLCLVFRRFRYAFVAVMLPFHVVIWVFMDILFWEQMALFILFFDISKWVERFKRRGFSLNAGG